MIKYKQTGDCAFVDRVADGWIRNKNHQMIEVGFYLVPIKQGYSNYFCAFFQNDSERKKTASDLKASQEIWQFALEGSGDGVWDWDFEGRQVYFSPQCKKILGYEAYEYMNTQEEWQTLLHPDDVEMLKGKTQEYVGNRIDSHSIEFRLKHKDGKYRWLLDRGKVMSYTPLGTPKRIVGYFQNITEKKKTEEALINSELQFRSLAENIPGLLFKYEHQSSQSEGFLFVTSNPEAKIGMSKAELDNFYNYIHEDDLHRETLISKMARDKNIPYHFEGRFVFPDKKMIWLSISSTITGRNDHGGIITTGIMLNITKQKEAEQLLQLSEEKYRNIISNMNLGLLEVDLDGVIQTANQSFCEMSGYSMEEFLYKNASDFFLKKEYRIMMKEKTELRKKSYSDAYEVPIKVKSGEQKWWLISGAPSFNDSGQLIGSIGIHLDITNQKQLEMELKEAKRLAEIAVSAKQQFLANMSHEIRTPMNVILGLTEQLQKFELGPQQHSFLKSVHAAADHLLLIINDVLDLTKVEGGRWCWKK
jgi:PAS domain S-box-containing protein